MNFKDFVSAAALTTLVSCSSVAPISTIASRPTESVQTTEPVKQPNVSKLENDAEKARVDELRKTLGSEAGLEKVEVALKYSPMDELFKMPKLAVLTKNEMQAAFSRVYEKAMAYAMQRGESKFPLGIVVKKYFNVTPNERPLTMVRIEGVSVNCSNEVVKFKNILGVNNFFGVYDIVVHDSKPFLQWDYGKDYIRVELNKYHHTSFPDKVGFIFEFFDIRPHPLTDLGQDFIINEEPIVEEIRNPSRELVDWVLQRQLQTSYLIDNISGQEDKAVAQDGSIISPPLENLASGLKPDLGGGIVILTPQFY